MSLSQDPIVERLQKHFVCGWKNIHGVEKFAGKSHSHPVKSTAVHTTNGAGGSNIQMIILDPDGHVLHVLPGYWNPDALRYELDFALELVAIAATDAPQDEKNDAFLLAHLNHAAKHHELMVRDSTLQAFDRRHEEGKGDSDFKRKGGEGEATRTVDQVMHERMAARPFLRAHEFDLSKVVDYGTRFYDKHGDGCCEGVVGDPKMSVPKGSGADGPWKKGSD